MTHPNKKIVTRTYLRVLPIVFVALMSAFLIQGESRRRPLKTTLKAPQSLWGQQGNWEESFSSGLLIHVSVLPNGKVLHFTQFSYPPTYSRLWNCVISTDVNPYGQCDTDYAGAHSQDIWYDGANLFCSGHTLLPDGRLFVAGGSLYEVGHDGTPATTIFKLDPSPDDPPHALAGPTMANGRWYPTAITLGNGETVIVSGDYCENHPYPNNPKCEGGFPNNSIPDVLSSDGTSLRQLTGANLERPLYPWLHLASDGRVFYSGPNTPGRWLNTAGTGSWSTSPTEMPQYYYSLNAPPLPETGFILYRGAGSSVMYEPNRVLIAGGGSVPLQGGGFAPTRTAETIDLSNTNNPWQPTGSMTYPRRHHDLTILADGKVLATGGTKGEGFNNTCPEHVIYAAELWNPKEGTWTTMATMPRRRQYHSTAVLLRDGRVLVGGTTEEPVGSPQPPPAPPCPPFVGQGRNDIFTPPYLYNSDGTYAARPLIHTAPQSVNYGQQFYVHTPSSASIDRVTLVRLSSVTHGVNMNQRFNELDFQRIGNVLLVTAPSSNNACPPGHYMLFIINSAGVPSIAKIVQVLPA